MARGGRPALNPGRLPYFKGSRPSEASVTTVSSILMPTIILEGLGLFSRACVESMK
jgi:hypothetical protein